MDYWRRSARRRVAADARRPWTIPSEPWRQAAEELGREGAVPETTTVIHEGELGRDNAAFPLFAPIAQTTECQQIKDREVASWVRKELRGVTSNLSERAIAVLVEAVGPDLWALYNELESWRSTHRVSPSTRRQCRWSWRRLARRSSGT